MNSAGIKNLGDVTITTALTDSVITTSSDGAFLKGLAGMQSVTVWANFVYGSGGTSIAAVLQTSVDQSQTWIDVARFDFATSSRKAHATIGIFSAGAVTTLGSLGSEGKLDNVLGDRLRVKVSSVGTYAGNSTLSMRASVR